MRHTKRIAVIIPAYNEEQSIGRVIADIPEWVDRVIVCDNNSTDGTADAARAAGAEVVFEEETGYGGACLRAMDVLQGEEVIVFLDGDYSDYPEQMERLVDPLLLQGADIVIGSRTLGRAERGALTPQQRWGNCVACTLIRLIWGHRYTDLGPFRALRYSALAELDMQDRTWGWTVEMQVKAVKQNMTVREVPVDYRKRIGLSKISGTISGVLRAGAKILYTIARETLRTREEPYPRQAIVMFTRYPEPGATKTRLIPALGAEGAARLHCEMAQHMAQVLRQCAERPETLAIVQYTGGNIPKMRDWLGTDLPYEQQAEGDLGARMLAAVEQAMPDADRVILVGTDCPFITSDLVQHAFALLRRHDLVIGPAEDGGYYLIGMRYPLSELFDGIEWGTSEVFQKTMWRADHLSLDVATLPALPDIDRPEDVPKWEARRDERQAQRGEPALSVVIPARNEEDAILSAMASAQRHDSVEIIVVDGGSTDNTARFADQFGACVVKSEPGRGVQMNAGAAHAQAHTILFLHADTWLPRGYCEMAHEALHAEGVVAGAFPLGIRGRGRILRLAERIANYRSRKLGLPYGDQAIFCRTDTFRVLGGFKELPIMEDFDFMERLRERGRIVLCPASVSTSARRWQNYGPLRLTLLHQAIILGYRLGISPERLAQWRGRSD